MRPRTIRVMSVIASLLLAPLPPSEARDMPARRVLAGDYNRVDFSAGLLSIKVHNVGVLDLLEQIASQAGFKVVTYVTLQQRLSIEFRHLPLQQGVSTILRGRSFVLGWSYPMSVTEPNAPPGAPTHTLWILPQRGDASPVQSRTLARDHTQVKRASIGVGTMHLQAALSRGSAQDRAEAIIDIGQRHEPGALAALTQALTESAIEIRQAAVTALGEIGGAEAARALGIALHDREARVREAAVNTLGDIGGMTAIELLRRALTDQTDFVRQAASETLAQLAATRRR